MDFHHQRLTNRVSILNFELQKQKWSLNLESHPGTFEALRWWADIEPATRMRARPSLPPSNGNCGCHAWTRTKTERLNRPPCYFDTTWQ